MMNRDAFPQLLSGTTGWPQLRVPWNNCLPQKHIDITVCENNDDPAIAMVDIDFPGPVRVFLNGRKMHF